jgi:hypothetical protein
MVGEGAPTIKTIPPIGAGKSGFYFGLDNEINLSGIIFRTDVTDADYGVGKLTGDVYNVSNNNLGKVYDCSFVFNSTLTTIDSSKEPKNYVCLGDRDQNLNDCVFHTIGTAAVPNLHGAFHQQGGTGDAGAEHITAINCIFLGQHIDTLVFASAPSMTSCKINEPNKWNIPLLSLYEARALCPATSRGLLDESLYNEFARGVGQNEYDFSAQIQQNAVPVFRTIFQVEDADNAITPRVYEIEIMCSYDSDGYGRFYYYYHATVDNGIAVVVSEHDSRAGGFIAVKITHNEDAPDVLELIERDSGTSWISGHVKFKPIRRGAAVVGAGNTNQFNQQIRFFDISEA